MIVSALTESAFVAQRQADWDALDRLVQRAAREGARSLPALDVTRVSPLYRDLCGDLSRARGARYSAPLVEYLQGLTAASHTLLYGRRPGGRFIARADALRYWLCAFPRAVRARKGAVLLATLLFVVPFVAGLLAAMNTPAFAFRVVPEAMLRPLTEHYAQGFDAGRQAGEGAGMAGFYVNNNVGIALRCFATGIFAGLGSAFFLLYNGLCTGAVFGYVVSQGAGFNFVTFVVGHSALELGAIILAGAAGLTMGWSIVSPGERTRMDSLRTEARDVLVIVGGATVMLLMAAGLEAFWSASSVPSAVKLVVGPTLFVAVVSYMTFAGRGHARAHAHVAEAGH